MSLIRRLFDRNPAAIFAKQPWTRLNLADYPRAANVPTMLSDEEQQFYIWATRHWMRDKGAVLDLGAFIGGSTARLAAGHKKAKLGGKIHSFDKFTVSNGIKERILYPQNVPRFEGRDMLPLAKDYLKPWRDRVIFQVGDIRETEWIPEPVEILALDAAKTDETTDFITQRFLRHMIPKASILIHQDFLHWNQPWLCAQMIGLENAFEPVAYCVPDTVVFFLKRELTEADITAATVTGLSDKALLDAIETTRAKLAHWDVDRRFKMMARGVRNNPGQRVAWSMKRAH